MKKRSTPFLLFVAVIIAATGSTVPVLAKPGATTRLSDPGTVEPNGPTPALSVPDTTSPDLALAGLKVAFSSDASNLVAGDSNGVADVFVRALPKGKIARASVTKGGSQANGPSYSPSLSVDGRWLAFVSQASNLVTKDTNGKADVFLKDLRSGSVRRLSIGAGGVQANGASNSPFVSLFGTHVTFESEATNLAQGDSNGLSDSFIRDVRRARTSRIAPPAIFDEFPRVPEKTWSTHARVSYDGRYVAYTRGGTRTTIDRPTSLDIFLLDRATGKNKAINVPAWAGEFESMSEEPVISADGHYVAFTTWSVWNNDTTVARAIQQPSPIRNNDGLARNDLDYKDIMMYDRISNVMFPVSTNIAGPVANADNFHPSITADGHQIAFVSQATNLVAGDTNAVADIIVRDLEERTTSRVSLAGAGRQARTASSRPSISYEGRRVAFASDDGSLTGGDTNLVSDAFLRDRHTEVPNRAPAFKIRSPLISLARAADRNRPAKWHGVNQGDDVSMNLQATDPDGDPLTYGVIVGLPTGATIDQANGAFRWKATADPAYYAALAVAAARPDTTVLRKIMENSDVMGGRVVPIVFWVQDPRGATGLAVVLFYIRDAQLTARCALGRSRISDPVNEAGQEVTKTASDQTERNIPWEDQELGHCVTRGP